MKTLQKVARELTNEQLAESTGLDRAHVDSFDRDLPDMRREIETGVMVDDLKARRDPETYQRRRERSHALGAGAGGAAAGGAAGVGLGHLAGKTGLVSKKTGRRAGGALGSVAGALGGGYLGKRRGKEKAKQRIEQAQQRG